ncbi:MAG: hypothetical protein ACFFG0_12225 [Candidatus Thorarchaeota archaeon]
MKRLIEQALSLDILNGIIKSFRNKKKNKKDQEKNIRNWLIQKQVYFGWHQTFDFVLPDDTYPYIGCDICRVARKSEKMYRNVESKALICSNCLYTMGIYLEAHKRSKTILEILLDRLTGIARSIGTEVNKMGNKESAEIIKKFLIKRFGDSKNYKFIPIVINLEDNRTTVSEIDASLMEELKEESNDEQEITKNS